MELVIAQLGDLQKSNGMTSCDGSLLSECRKLTKLLACLNNFEAGIRWFIIIYCQSPTFDLMILQVLGFGSMYGFNDSLRKFLNGGGHFSEGHGISN